VILLPLPCQLVVVFVNPRVSGVGHMGSVRWDLGWTQRESSA